MFEMICGVLREYAAHGILPAHLGQFPLARETRLSELGIDSLGKLTVLSEVCGRMDLPQFDLEMMDERLSLGEFAHLLERAAEPLRT